jgi:hypothetical protein
MTEAIQIVAARIDVGSRRFQNLIALGLTAFFVFLSVLSVQKVSITADEAYHLRYGANILSLRARRIDDSKMPISALNALPGKLAAHLPAGGLRDFFGSLFAARLATILFSACVAYLVFHWSRALYGFYAGLASLLLYVLDPNLIAHSQLVTTDVYAAGFVLIASFWIWKFAGERNLYHGLMCACALGLSQLAKYSTIVLLPLLVLALVLYDLPIQIAAFRSKGASVFGKSLGRLVFYIAIALASMIVFINVGFVFYQSFLSLKDYQFSSDAFRALQRVSALQNVRVPFPYPYLQGLDLISSREQAGWRIYLLGQLRVGQGFPGYYFVASVLKVPIATQIILIAAWVMFLVVRQRRNTFLKNEVFLLLPVIFYTIYFNFFYKSQLGIRFYLIVFPLLYVFAGGLFSSWQEFSRRRKIAVFILLGYLIVSVLSYYPFYLAYFNELVWDRKYAYKFLVDSNLDWAQGGYYLNDYLSAHPDAVRSPAHVISGDIVVSPTDLVGVTEDAQKYAWLRENFEPVRTVAYEYLVYEVRPADLERLCKTRSICP